ncbi:MAG: metallophosphoesterase [Candidatus Improbicoccus devescovinae]|nr:MAG: metallophosphoesterase [Candidatus Improbicoccus devescovinae]
MLYGISDIHLSFGTLKSMDIFPGWLDYVSKIKQKWLAQVLASDTVVVAGDISWAMELEDCEKDFEFLDSLPGEKILIRGNHDFWWSSITKINNFLSNRNFKTIKLIQNNSVKVGNCNICGTRGWIFNSKEDYDNRIYAREIERLKLSLSSCKDPGIEKIVFFHYPPVYVYEKCEKIIDILLENNVMKCYYGHVHGCDSSRIIYEGLYRGIEFNLLSCDYLNFGLKLIC